MKKAALFLYLIFQKFMYNDKSYVGSVSLDKITIKQSHYVYSVAYINLNSQGSSVEYSQLSNFKTYLFKHVLKLEIILWFLS